MKIVFITNSYFPSIGGVEIHAQAVARELVKRGHRVSVVTEYKQSNSKSDNKAISSKSNVLSTQFVKKRLDQIDIYYFKFGQKSFNKKFKIWFSLIKNRKIFKDADIVHIHDVFIWYLPLRLLYWNKRVFTTFHGYETVFPPTDKARAIRKISEKLSYGNIVIGDFIKKWYGTQSDYVLYGGINKPVKIRKVLERKHLRINILLIGRLEKDIGVLVYRDALRILKEKGMKFNLLISGEGSLKPEIESYGKIQGFVRDLRESIKEADIVFSSSYLTMLEVLQYAKPIFAAYTNPLKHEYLRNSPFEEFITISESGSDLAKKIMSFKPNRKKLIKGAHWANLQTWQKVTDIYLELWQKK